MLIVKSVCRCNGDKCDIFSFLKLCVVISVLYAVFVLFSLLRLPARVHVAVVYDGDEMTMKFDNHLLCQVWISTLWPERVTHSDQSSSTLCALSTRNY